ncbi:MAG: tRNA pseudouridine(55) synthase TruB [Candidatus Xenobia bacterium]
MSVDGFLNVLKPPGMSSADVVAWCRRRLGQRQIGHLGTLDPAAAGVLPMAIGHATRLIPFVSAPGPEKEYVAEAHLGVVTDSQDATGRVLESRAVEVGEAQVKAELLAMLGDQEQIPPMASALQQDGRRLYDLFRAGIEVPREARRIHIHAVELLSWQVPRGRFRIACSGGTYVRTICHDLGARLGCGAHMSFLVRTASGPFHLADSVRLEQVSAAAVADPLPVLQQYPLVRAREDAYRAVRDGRLLPAEMLLDAWPSEASLVRLADAAGTHLIALARPEGERLHPIRVIVP